MRIRTLKILVRVAFLVFAAQAAEADIWFTPHFTNAAVAMASRDVLDAIRSPNSRRIEYIETLIGEPVAYVGEASYGGGGTNIMVTSNIVLNVVLQPPRSVGVSDASGKIEVMGTLQRVDFERRIIYIVAKPEDYLRCFSL